MFFAHITQADGPGIVTILLIGIAVGVVVGLLVASVRVRGRR